MIAIQWYRRPWLSEGLSQATLVMIGARGTCTIPYIAAIRTVIVVAQSFANVLLQHNIRLMEEIHFLELF